MQLDELSVERREGIVKLGRQVVGDRRVPLLITALVVIRGADDVIGGVLRGHHATREFLAQRRPLHGRSADRETL